jgi:hypothetical protein
MSRCPALGDSAWRRPVAVRAVTKQDERFLPELARVALERVRRLRDLDLVSKSCRSPPIQIRLPIIPISAMRRRMLFRPVSCDSVANAAATG